MENKIKIVALFGEAGAGKDACLKEISYGQEEKIHKIVSYTTRPPRSNEHPGYDYKFTTEEDFMTHNFIAQSEFNGWFYGVDKEDLKIDRVNIGVFNLTELYQMLDNKNLYVIPVWVWAPPKIRLLRQLNRELNPNCHEIVRRYKEDAIDFEELYSKKTNIHPYFLLNGEGKLSDNCASLKKYILDM